MSVSSSTYCDSSKKYDICMINIEHIGNVVNGLLIEINESSICFEIAYDKTGR